MAAPDAPNASQHPRLTTFLRRLRQLCAEESFYLEVDDYNQISVVERFGSATDGRVVRCALHDRTLGAFNFRKGRFPKWVQP